MSKLNVGDVVTFKGSTNRMTVMADYTVKTIEQYLVGWFDIKNHYKSTVVNVNTLKKFSPVNSGHALDPE